MYASPPVKRADIPVANEETNAIIKEFLHLISTFQIRLKETNPLKAKQKQRFVSGIKQATNGVKANKVRIVFLAINTEASEALDDKLDALINEAKQREVPICYCLSKRLLGKAVQKTMKQAVVAVYDPDGAFDLFKKIIRYLDPDV
jgi:ribosomal protein L7Ae-like RNA K-turn-binding protein